jgi:hypothetical protein
MTETPPRNNERRTRGRPFQPGNPGRPKGARHKTTIAIEALLDGEAERLTRKAVEKALEGDVTALRLCLDRLLPPRRDRYVHFKLPSVDSIADLPRASAALLSAVSSAKLTPTEAAELAKTVDAHVRAVEAADFDRRLTALEKRKPT